MAASDREDPPGEHGQHRQPGEPGEPDRPLPPQAVLGLLNYVTATSLDEDYAHVARRRVTVAERPHSPRRGLWTLVVLAVFGALMGTAAVRTSENAAQSARSHDALVGQIDARKAQLARRQDRARTLRAEIAASQSQVLDASIQLRLARSQASGLEVVAGMGATRGPGLRIRADDNPTAIDDKHRVLGQDLQKMVNGLWQAGAEAISINGLRLTNLTAVRGAGEAITVNYRSLQRPYLVSAIGNPDQLGARFLDTTGGQTWVALESSFGLVFDVTTEESMSLPAAEEPTLTYARARLGQP